MTNRMTNRRLLNMTTAAAASLLIASACDPSPDAAEPTESPVEQELHGPQSYEGCTVPQSGFLRETIRVGRIASSSNAFISCVRESMATGVGVTGPYRLCKVDPFRTSSLPNQTDAVLEATRTLNPVLQACGVARGDAALASAGIHPWGQVTQEGINWHSWLTAVVADLDKPACGPCTSNTQCPGGTCQAGRCAGGCRYAPYPWPYSQAAGVLWHEVMHQHGYDHGAGAGAAAFCQPDGADYSQNWGPGNTAPHIVQNCLAATIDGARAQCGDINAGCGGGLKLQQHLSSTTCVCVKEASPVPGMTRLTTYWNGGRADHATFATDVGKDSAGDASYVEAYEEGFAPQVPLPQTVPLKLFWHAGRQDNALATTADSEQMLRNEGYVYVRDEGRAYQNKHPGTAQLKIFFHQGRGDYYTGTSPQGQAAVLAAGYLFKRNEGWVFRSNPLRQTVQLYDNGRGDHLLVGSKGSLLTDAQNDSGSRYTIANREAGRPFEPPIFAQMIPSGRALEVAFRDDRGDHFSFGTQVGSDSAVGYRRLGSQGVVLDLPIMGTVPLKLFWHGGRQDNLTTGLGGEFSAIPTGYGFVRNEGWTLPLARPGARCSLRQGAERCNETCPCGFNEGICQTTRECHPGLTCQQNKCR